MKQLHLFRKGKGQENLPDEWRNDAAKGMEHLIVEQVIVPRRLCPCRNLPYGGHHKVPEQLRGQIGYNEDSQ